MLYSRDSGAQRRAEGYCIEADTPWWVRYRRRKRAEQNIRAGRCKRETTIILPHPVYTALRIDAQLALAGSKCISLLDTNTCVTTRTVYSDSDTDCLTHHGPLLFRAAGRQITCWDLPDLSRRSTVFHPCASSLSWMTTDGLVLGWCGPGNHSQSGTFPLERRDSQSAFRSRGPQWGHRCNPRTLYVSEVRHGWVSVSAILLDSGEVLRRIDTGPCFGSADVLLRPAWGELLLAEPFTVLQLPGLKRLRSAHCVNKYRLGLQLHSPARGATAVGLGPGGVGVLDLGKLDFIAGFPQPDNTGLVVVTVTKLFVLGGRGEPTSQHSHLSMNFDRERHHAVEFVMTICAPQAE